MNVKQTPATLAAAALATMRTALRALPPESDWKLAGNWLTLDVTLARRQERTHLRLWLRDSFSRERLPLGWLDGQDLDTLTELRDEFRAVQAAARRRLVGGSIVMRIKSEGA